VGGGGVGALRTNTRADVLGPRPSVVCTNMDKKNKNRLLSLSRRNETKIIIIIIIRVF
jgi:hypothetical protein